MSRTLGRVISALEITTFCWLPPERLETGFSGLGDLDPEAAHEVARALGLGASGQGGRRVVNWFSAESVMFSRIDMIWDQAIALAVLGDQRDATLDPGRDPRRAERPAVEPHLAAGMAVQPDDAFEELAAPRAHQAVEPEDLAGMRPRARRDRPPARRPRRGRVTFSARKTRRPTGASRGGKSLEASPIIALDDPGQVDPVHRPGAGDDPVPQHGDVVADPDQFLEPMARYRRCRRPCAQSRRSPGTAPRLPPPTAPKSARQGSGSARSRSAPWRSRRSAAGRCAASRAAHLGRCPARAAPSIRPVLRAARPVDSSRDACISLP